LKAFELFADGSLSQYLTLPAGGSRRPFSRDVLKERSYYTKMDGQAVFRFSVREISRISKKVLEKAGVPLEEVDWFIPHQANLRIIQSGRRNWASRWTRPSSPSTSMATPRLPPFLLLLTKSTAMAH